MKLRTVMILAVVLTVIGLVIIGSIASREGTSAVSIGFIGYRENVDSIWAQYAVTNRSRLDYSISVRTEPHVSTDLWFNTPGISPAGSVVTNEIWIANHDESYRLVLSAYVLPLGPPGWQRQPGLAFKCLSRFARGQTRTDLLSGAISLSTNETFIIRSPKITPWSDPRTVLQ
jgi:hypothetical protein